MKTQQKNLVKTAKTIMLSFALLTFAACSSQDAKPGQNTKPPAMDIHTATLLGDLDVVRQHIKAGTDLNDKEPAGGSTPLITASVFGKTEVAIALIEAGADLNSTNNEGSTPLHCAAFFCHTGIVEALLDGGADKDLRNIYGSTALESIADPWKDVKGIYDEFSKALGPLGLKLDYGHLEETRPIIAEMLR